MQQRQQKREAKQNANQELLPATPYQHPETEPNWDNGIKTNNNNISSLKPAPKMPSILLDANGVDPPSRSTLTGAKTAGENLAPSAPPQKTVSGGVSQATSTPVTPFTAECNSSTTASTANTAVTFGTTIHSVGGVGFVPTTALEQYRLQLYNYALNIERLRCPQYTAAAAMAAAAYSHSGDGNGAVAYTSPSTYVPAHSRLALSMSLFPQRIFQSEEPKPQHSYIGLIAMAILSSAESKLVLSDIYQYILDNYPYFRTRGPGWRNSIRHNLSLNDCFIKSGRSANGKGHYWAIHPANIEDFRKGDFRRRKAQRKVRKHMGLAVDDAGTDSPSPPPLDLTSPPPPPHPLAATQQLAVATAAAHSHAFSYFQQHYQTPFQQQQQQYAGIPAYGNNGATVTALSMAHAAGQLPRTLLEPRTTAPNQRHGSGNQQPSHLYTPTFNNQLPLAIINKTTTTANVIANLYSQSRKRQFDVASLLAPDVKVDDSQTVQRRPPASITTTEHTVITKVSVQHQQQSPPLHLHQNVSQSLPAYPATTLPPESYFNVSDQDEQEDIDVVASDAEESRHMYTAPNQNDDQDYDNLSLLSASRRSSIDITTEAANSSRRQSPSPLSDMTNPELHTLMPTHDGQASLVNVMSTQYELHHSSSLSSHPDSIDLPVPALQTVRHSNSPATTYGHQQQPESSLEGLVVQQLKPVNGLTNVDPHIFGRYYGTYMAAAAARRIGNINLTLRTQQEQPSPH